MDRIGLIRGCQQGDPGSFEQLYKSYSKNALGTAYLIAKHRDIAEDIVQEAFFQCYRGIKKLKDPDAFDVWFYKLLVRLAWKMTSEYRHTKPLDELQDEVVTGISQLDAALEGKENKLILYEAVGKLSLPLRTVIILHYFNDMTIKQIAMVLDCFQGTVKSRLHNARKQLEAELRSSFDEDFYKTMYMEKECKING